MCDNNAYPFIATFHNILLAPALWDRLFSITTVTNSGYTCLLHKWFCTVYFVAKVKNAITLPHITLMKHAFWGEIKEMSKTKKLPSRKKIVLELLHHILGHRSTISLFDGDTANVLEYIELRIDPDPFSHHVKFLQ